MERRKQYNEKQVEQDLYQYEMGIELGADVEAEKRNHQNEYDKEHSSQDFKNNFNNNNQSNRSGFFMFRNTLRYRPASYALASQGPWPCSRH